MWAVEACLCWIQNVFWHLEPSQKPLPLPTPLVYLPLHFTAWLMTLTQKNSQLQNQKLFFEEEVVLVKYLIKTANCGFPDTPQWAIWHANQLLWQHTGDPDALQLVKIRFTTSLNVIQTSPPNIGLLASQLFMGVLLKRQMSGTNCCKRSLINTAFAQIWYFQWMQHPAFLASALIHKAHHMGQAWQWQQIAMQMDNRETCTIIPVICADGEVYGPTVIFKGNRFVARNTCPIH